MIIYTCPKCGHDLANEVLDCYPPINRYVCHSCGWSHSEQEKVVRIPFGGNMLNNTPKQKVDDMVDLTDYKPNHVITTLNTPMQPSNAMYESSSCVHCTNNPKNGGSGICHCILGSQEITY